MKFLDRIILLFVLFSLLGFSHIVQDNVLNETENDRPKLKEITINNGSIDRSEEKEIKSLTPVISFKPLGIMKASWYGPGFHGKLTANGEIYNQFEYTAAHKTMKFGTLLRLTNPSNGKSIIVRINDRGPYIEGRDLDLSFASAKALGFLTQGVKNLKVEVVEIKNSTELFAKR